MEAPGPSMLTPEPSQMLQRPLINFQQLLIAPSQPIKYNFKGFKLAVVSQPSCPRAPPDGPGRLMSMPYRSQMLQRPFANFRNFIIVRSRARARALAAAARAFNALPFKIHNYISTSCPTAGARRAFWEGETPFNSVKHIYTVSWCAS